MSLFSILGIGGKKLVETGICTRAEVTGQKTLWWIKINTKAVRIGPSDGAVFPGYIRFTYKVEGIEYKGSRVVSPYIRCPVKGEYITVYYDDSEPAKHTVKI